MFDCLLSGQINWWGTNRENKTTIALPLPFWYVHCNLFINCSISIPQQRIDRNWKQSFSSVMINYIAILVDCIIWINYQSLREYVLAIEIGTLLVNLSIAISIRNSYLIAHTMRNVSSKKTPFITASELLCRQTESSDFFRSPVTLPLLHVYSLKLLLKCTRCNMTIEVWIRICFECATTTFFRRVLVFIPSFLAYIRTRSLTSGRFLFFCSFLLFLSFLLGNFPFNWYTASFCNFRINRSKW